MKIVLKNFIVIDINIIDLLTLISREKLKKKSVKKA